MNPPAGVKLVLEAVCIMKEVKPVGGPHHQQIVLCFCRCCLGDKWAGPHSFSSFTCISPALAHAQQVRMRDARSGRMVDDYWEASKKMLMEDDFLKSLQSYDKDNIDPAIIKRIQVCWAEGRKHGRGVAMLLPMHQGKVFWTSVPLA